MKLNTWTDEINTRDMDICITDVPATSDTCQKGFAAMRHLAKFKYDSNNPFTPWLYLKVSFKRELCKNLKKTKHKSEFF